jgi:hypothetical protein
MRLRNIEVVVLRAMITALNRHGFRNSDVARLCGIGVEHIARLMGMAVPPGRAEIERIKIFARANLPCLQPPRKLTPRRGLIRYAGQEEDAPPLGNGRPRPPAARQAAVAPPPG